MLLEPKLFEFLTVMTSVCTFFGLCVAFFVLEGPNSARQRLKEASVALFCGVFFVVVGPCALLLFVFVGAYKFIKDLYHDN